MREFQQHCCINNSNSSNNFDNNKTNNSDKRFKWKGHNFCASLQIFPLQTWSVVNVYALPSLSPSLSLSLPLSPLFVSHTPPHSCSISPSLLLLTLYQTHTHTHTHTLSLCSLSISPFFTLSFSPSPSLSLSLSLRKTVKIISFVAGVAEKGIKKSDMKSLNVLLALNSLHTQAFLSQTFPALQMSLDAFSSSSSQNNLFWRLSQLVNWIIRVVGQPFSFVID